MASSTLARRLGLTGNRGCKAPVRAGTTANITLSGEQTVGGVAVVDGDRVLVWHQTDATANGIYDVSTGAWTRSIDANGTQDWSSGTIGIVVEGTYASQFWILTTTGSIVPGTTSLVFQVGVPTLAALSPTSGAGLVGFSSVLVYAAGTVGRWLVDLATSVGSSLIGTIAAGAGAVLRTVQAKLRDWVHVDDYGAVGDGVTNDAPAIQAAIDSGASRILFGQKKYRINTCLNLADRGTRSIKLQGCGAPFGGDTPGTTGSTILGYTGTWMIDSTGSSFTDAEDLLIVAITSKGGWLQARSAVGTYALYNRMKKVYIYVPTSPAFTSVGSIALFCDNVENQVVEQCWFEADTAYVTSMNNEIAVASVYSTISTATHSNTDVSHRQNVYKGITGAGMLLIGQASSTYDQCFWQRITGSYSHAIVTQNSTGGYQTCQKLRFTGQIEDYDYGFLLTNDTTNIRIDLTTSSVNTALVRLGAATNHYGLYVNIQCYTRAANKRVLDSTTATPANVYGGTIVVSDGGKLDSAYIKYIGTNLQMAAVDTHDNAQFNYAAGSTYVMTSLTTPLFASGALTAGAILDKASFGGGITCTGAALGDFVKVSANIDMQGCSLTGYVSSANNVVAVINNNTGGTKTFGSATYKFVVTH